MAVPVPQPKVVPNPNPPKPYTAAGIRHPTSIESNQRSPSESNRMPGQPTRIEPDVSTHICFRLSQPDCPITLPSSMFQHGCPGEEAKTQYLSRLIDAHPASFLER